MVLKTYKNSTDNLILFKSEDYKVNIPEMKTHAAEKIDCKFAYLTIIPFKNKLRLNYKFNIDIKEDLPIYLENIIGLLMKKIFYRLKVFIEEKSK